MDKTIPRKDVDFDVRQQIVSETVQANVQAWNLDADWLNAEFYPKKAAWDSAWEAYLNPQTRTQVITFVKQNARRDFQLKLRQLAQLLIHNPRVSAVELAAMGIALPSHSRTPAQPADSYPDFTVDSSVIRCLKLYFLAHGRTNRAKPRHMRGVEVRWAILGAPPASVEDLTHSAFATRTPFALEFDENERGRTVYFCLRWENTRGEKGPWSEIGSAIIP
ncbi:MAG: hypothetical protein LBT76_02770 [Tannerella sp.]|jgi:hypothetical protein|nr:hypothetical protein [Tannerella sp.]